MSKRHIELFIVDILIAIDRIRRYHQDHNDAESFFYDEKSFDATMRELQIIGEATKHLLQAQLIDDTYRIVVDFRNVIVHEYFGIDADEIWDILQNELPTFENTIYSLIKRVDQETLGQILHNATSHYRGKTRLLIEKLQQEIVEQ